MAGALSSGTISAMEGNEPGKVAYDSIYGGVQSAAVGMGTNAAMVGIGKLVSDLKIQANVKVELYT